MAPGSQALLAVVPTGLVAPKLSHGRACDTSGRAAGPSGLVAPREGPRGAALGQRRKKTNIETHPAWGRRQSLCKAGSQQGCGQGTGAWGPCPWLRVPHSSRGHPKVSVGQAVTPTQTPCPVLLWHGLSSTAPCPWHCRGSEPGAGTGTGVFGLPGAHIRSKPPTQDRKTLGSVLLLPPPPLTLPSHGHGAPAGTRGGLGAAPTLGSWDWDLTELQGLWFRG